MENIKEGDLYARLHKKADQVRPPQSAVLLPGVVVELGVFAVFDPILPFALLAVLHVHHHHQRRAGDEDELQGPQPDVGHWEEVVVADVGAAGLFGVAVEVFLLVPPNSFCSYDVNHDSKHKNHREPDTAEGSGVFVHPAEQGLKCLPVHGSELLLFLNSSS